MPKAQGTRLEREKATWIEAGLKRKRGAYTKPSSSGSRPAQAEACSFVVMTDDPNKTGDWHFSVKCRKCGSRISAFRDRSRGRIRPSGNAEYVLSCESCGYQGTYRADELRSEPASPA